MHPHPQTHIDALRLTTVPGLGGTGLARLSKAFPSASGLLHAPDEAWARAGIPRRLHGPLRAAAGGDVGPQCEAIERAGVWTLSLFDEGYPPLLREIHDPPFILYGLGDPAVLGEPAVAMVGSRHATSYGLFHAERIARGLAQAGLVVVSGLAHGIDGASHKAVLQAGGLTVAVLGTAPTHIYPAEHKGLAARVTERGALVSEWPPGTPVERAFFARRNRMISGLVRAVVILEAGEKSGALITARQALDQGREVLVVPGPAGGPNRGGHVLLTEGAGLIEEAADVIAACSPAFSAADAGARQVLEVPPEFQAVWDALGNEPVHVDTVISRSRLRSSEVLGILLQMELHGWARPMGGKTYIRGSREFGET